MFQSEFFKECLSVRVITKHVIVDEYIEYFREWRGSNRCRDQCHAHSLVLLLAKNFLNSLTEPFSFV